MMNTHNKPAEISICLLQHCQFVQQGYNSPYTIFHFNTWSKRVEYTILYLNTWGKMTMENGWNIFCQGKGKPQFSSFSPTFTFSHLSTLPFFPPTPLLPPLPLFPPFHFPYLPFHYQILLSLLMVCKCCGCFRSRTFNIEDTHCIIVVSHVCLH